MRDRQTDRGRERERETDRQTDRDRDRERERERERESYFQWSVDLFYVPQTYPKPSVTREERNGDWPLRADKKDTK